MSRVFTKHFETFYVMLNRETNPFMESEQIQKGLKNYATKDFTYSDGVIWLYFLKDLLKVTLLLKPTS